MTKQQRFLVVASLVYWCAALSLMFLAIGAPCGLAPSEVCEVQGPTLFGKALGVFGPLGTFMLASILYTVAVWLSHRRRKGY